MTRPRIQRCAVYTRKSSEEGLEQDFNSLHAQRESCEAFIKSQQGEGWKLIPTPYDDGAISGGTMERPALKQLLADIALGKVDVIVVYKVDRLTRALSDFAKMVEVFDAHHVSFVAVTQQFNTTTSMGRLTLNVLLSFAQFEREVTGERIRDKIAASKRKGMWMGGTVPLGYRVVDRKLLVVPAEAEVVRLIYDRYLELGSVRALRTHLHDIGISSKSAIRNGSKPRIDRFPFSRGALYFLLQNPVYIGEIRHKELRHPGMHESIISKVLWNKVQLLLSDQSARLRGSHRKTESSPLMGRLWDDQGRRIGPSHTTKKGRRYRYYVSSSSDQASDKNQGWRLPATQLESIVAIGVIRVLGDQVSIASAAEATHNESQDLAGVLQSAKQIIENTDAQSFDGTNQLLGFVNQATVKTDGIQLTVNLPIVINGKNETLAVEGFVPLRMKRRGVETRLVIQGGAAPASKSDPALLKVVAKGHQWFDELMSGRVKTVKQIAQREGVTDRYVSRMLPLAFLSPEIVTSIVNGTQPIDLSAISLTQRTEFDADWMMQREALGF